MWQGQQGPRRYSGFFYFFTSLFLFCWNWLIQLFAWFMMMLFSQINDCYTFRIEVIHSCVIWAPSAIGWRRSSKLKRIKSKEVKWELIQTHIHCIVEKKDWKMWRDTNVILYQMARRFNVFGNIHWTDYCVFRSARTSWNTFVGIAGIPVTRVSIARAPFCLWLRQL